MKKEHKPFIILGPGDTIKEELEYYGWDQERFAKIMEMSDKQIEDLLVNKMLITYDLARKLSEIFKQSLNFWLDLDLNYIVAKFNKQIKEGSKK